MQHPQPHDPPQPLDGLDDRDRDRAADMLDNRPLYEAGVSPGAPVPPANEREPE